MPELRVIVLTGFDNFEYARQSLRLQVQDFFLKPIDEDDLSDAIEKQLKEIKKLKDEEKEQARLWRSQGSVAQMRLEQCMRNLVHEKIIKRCSFIFFRRIFGLTLNRR